MSSTNKRSMVSQGDTPGKPKSKTHRTGSGREERSSKKSLGFETLPKIKKGQTFAWSEEEIKGLIKFIADNWNADGWPTTHEESFWLNCAEKISRLSGKDLRTSNAVRTKTLKKIQTEFKTVEEAKKF